MKTRHLPFLFIPLAVACQEVEQPKTVLTQEQWNEVKKNILDSAPEPQFPVGANFENKIELIGFDVDTPIKPGEKTTFTFYWKALDSIEENWKVFVHLESGGRRHNLDHSPVNGMYETGRWNKGEIIKDEYTDTIPANFPAGRATPYIGFWRGQTRLKIANDVPATKEAQPRVIGPTLQVQKGAASAPANDAEKPKYAIRTLDAESLDITIDGKLDEDVWRRLAPAQLQPFGQAERQMTWAKMFVTDEHLYLAANLADQNIWGTMKNRDDETWKQEVFEFFLDVDGDGKDYLELQVTPQNTVFDARFAERLGTTKTPRDQQITTAKGWNADGLETAVDVRGTLNQQDDKDQAWTIEIRLPLASIPGLGEKKPEAGDTWAMNFYRFDRPREGTTWAYAWSTGPRGDFHQVDKFGEGRITPTVDLNRPAVTPELVEQMRKNIDLKVRPEPGALRGPKVLDRAAVERAKKAAEAPEPTEPAKAD